MRLYEFTELNESYPLAQQEFSQAASPDEVTKTIASFRDAINKNKVTGPEKDINTWRKEGWNKFKQFVSQVSAEKTKTDVKKARDTGNFETLIDNVKWTVVIPLDMDASAHFGRNSDWCTTKREKSYFSQYFLDGNITLVYCIQKQTGNKWAMALYPTGETECFDVKDNKITEEELATQSGIDVALVKELTGYRSNKVDVGRDKLHKQRGTSRAGAEMLEIMLSINRAGYYNGTQNTPLDSAIAKIKEAMQKFGFDFANDLELLLDISIDAGQAPGDDHDYALEYENHLQYMERKYKTSPLPWEDGWF